MTSTPHPARSTSGRADIGDPSYALEHQIGFLLRKAHQRHRSLFSRNIGVTLAPTQFATLASLYVDGPTSQNQLGRRTAMDTATITGVVDRLLQRKLVRTTSSPDDDRLTIVDLTDDGRQLIEELFPRAENISDMTLAPLDPEEQATLLELLSRIAEG